MKTIVLIFFLFLVPALSSNGEKKGFSSEHLSLLGKFNGQLYFLVKEYTSKQVILDYKNSYLNYYIKTFDKEMNLQNKLKIGENGEFIEKTGDGKQIFKVERVIMYDGKLILFTSNVEVLVPKTGLNMETIDPISLSYQLNRKKIMEVTSSLLIFDPPSFFFEISDDDSKLMVVGTPSFTRKKPESYSIAVFGNDLQLLWEKKIDLPYQDREIEFSTPSVRNNGDAYLICSRGYLSKKEKENHPEDINFTRLFEITGAGTSVLEKKIDLGIKLSSNTVIGLSGDKVRIAALSYDDPSKCVNGCYFTNYDIQTDKIVNQSSRYFLPGEGRVDIPKGTEWVVTGKNPDKGKAFEIKSSILDSAGNRFYCAEQAFTWEDETIIYGSYGLNNHSTMIRETKGDIIVFKVNPAGTIDWITRVIKVQAFVVPKGTINDDRVFGSYYASMVGNHLLFVVNDNPKNLSVNSGKHYPFNGDKGYIQLITVNGEGKITKKAIAMEKMVYPESGTQISDHEWLFKVIDASKNQSFMNIDLNKFIQ